MTITRPLISALAMSLLLISCGGGGGSSAGSVGGTSVAPATVAIALTDAPSSSYDQALATITSIQLLGNGAPVVLFSGSETVDLLKLADYSELFAVANSVPPGEYNKIRLQLASLTLIKLNAAGQVVESIDADLVANGKLDLNPQGPFTVVPGANLVISLDFDVAKSLKITTTGNGKVIVRPVIFVNIHPAAPLPKLARIHGLIDSIGTDGSLRICQTDLVARPHHDEQRQSALTGNRCLQVETDGATGVFGQDGLPQTFADLAVGEEATIIGRLQPLQVRVNPLGNGNGNGGDNGNGNGHGNGQGNGGSNDNGHGNGGGNNDGDSDTGSGDDDNDDGDHQTEDCFLLQALIIEEGPVGTYTRYRGVAQTGVDQATDQFDLTVAPGQGIVSDGPLPVQLYDESRLFARDGSELSRSAIQPGTSLVTDSVLALIGGNSVLRTPLVVIGDTGPVEVTLRGQVLSVNAGTGAITMTTATGDRCVNAADADIFLIVDNGDSLDSSRGTLADLTVGEPITAFGHEGTGGCLTAETILAGSGTTTP